jgi:membrane dipeptidase
MDAWGICLSTDCRRPGYTIKPMRFTMNRREFIRQTVAFTATGLLPLSRQSRAASASSQTPTFDLHCHPGAFYRRGLEDYGGDQGFEKTVAEMRRGGLSAAFFSIVADSILLGRDDKGIVVSDRNLSPGELWTDCGRQLSALDDLAQRGDIMLVTRPRQVLEARKRGKVAAFIACEGGHGLEGRTDRLDDLYRRGARSLQLTHYAQNDLGDLQTQPPVYHGLSSFGTSVVRRMNQLGMVVDVAHASFEAVKDTVSVTTSPIILSHTHLQSDTSPHPRLITAEHARLVASTGGLIGAWPSGFANRTFDDFVDQTLRLIDVVGVDHVGLGTDMDGNFKPVFSSYLQMPDWVAALRSKGLSEGDVAKVAGGNAMRVLGQVMKA